MATMAANKKREGITVGTTKDTVIDVVVEEAVVVKVVDVAVVVIFMHIPNTIIVILLTI